MFGCAHRGMRPRRCKGHCRMMRLRSSPVERTRRIRLRRHDEPLLDRPEEIIVAAITCTRGQEPRSAVLVSTCMEYRGVEYALIQGLGRQVWKWSVSLDADRSATGQAATKAEAASQAERAIDRALALRKLRLVPPAGGT